MTPASGMSAAVWAMLIVLSLLWGGSFVFVGIALVGLPPLTIVALRLGIGALALVAVLGATLSYAFAGVFGRRFRAMGVDPVATAAGQVTASALMVGPLALMVERPWTLPPPGWEVWAAVLGLALLSTAAAYVLYFRILAAAGATNLLLVTFLIPPWAILMGWAVLDERLAPQHLAGLALIGAGLAAIDGRLLRMCRARGQ